jgi:hypothetical protein
MTPVMRRSYTSADRSSEPIEMKFESGEKEAFDATDRLMWLSNLLTHLKIFET